MKKGRKKKLIPSRPNLWMNLLQTPIYHGFCYTHFIMEQQNNKIPFTLTVGDVQAVNEYFGEEILVIDAKTLTFKPADEKRFRQLLDAEKRGAE